MSQRKTGLRKKIPTIDRARIWFDQSHGQPLCYTQEDPTIGFGGMKTLKAFQEVARAMEEADLLYITQGGMAVWHSESLHHLAIDFVDPPGGRGTLERLFQNAFNEYRLLQRIYIEAGKEWIGSRTLVPALARFFCLAQTPPNHIGRALAPLVRRNLLERRVYRFDSHAPHTADYRVIHAGMAYIGVREEEENNPVCS